MNKLDSIFIELNKRREYHDLENIFVCEDKDLMMDMDFYNSKIGETYGKIADAYKVNDEEEIELNKEILCLYQDMKNRLMDTYLDYSIFITNKNMLFHARKMLKDTVENMEDY